MSRTRQSLPPLYERESSSRLERSAVSVPILAAHVLPGGLSGRRACSPVFLQCFFYDPETQATLLLHCSDPLGLWLSGQECFKPIVDLGAYDG
jgi:hypothetical protein